MPLNANLLVIRNYKADHQSQSVQVQLNNGVRVTFDFKPLGITSVEFREHSHFIRKVTSDLVKDNSTDICRRPRGSSLYIPLSGRVISRHVETLTGIEIHRVWEF